MVDSFRTIITGVPCQTTQLHITTVKHLKQET